MTCVNNYTPWVEVRKQIQETTMLEPRDGKIIYPYEEATIELVEIQYSDVLPTTKYVLRKNLVTQANLSVDLQQQGYASQLDLEGSLELISESGEYHKLTPPIVETTDEDHTYIIDGAHRTVIGRWLGRSSFNAIHISGIRPDCPSYARPNSWEEIRIYENLPLKNELKKDYRPNPRGLYRNFGPINGSSLRKA